MKPNNNIIIYDDTCPMCALYTGAFVKTGLLPPNGRQSFSTADGTLLATIDTQRSKDEIPLINTQTGRVLYGIDALLEILGARCPLIKTTGNIAPVKWFLLRLYRLISYNRRVIVAPAPQKEGTFNCTPAFNTRYRVLFVLLIMALNTLLLFTLHRNLFLNSAFAGLAEKKLLLVYGGLILFNIAVAVCLRGSLTLEYLGQAAMLFTLLFLLLLPVALLNSVLPIDPLINTIFIGIAAGCIILEHMRRMRFAGIWPRFTWVIVANAAAALSAFIITLLP